MTEKRIRELRQISARLYSDMLDKMGSHEYGHVFAGEEETIVLANISQKIVLDLTKWVEEDNKEK